MSEENQQNDENIVEELDQVLEEVGLSEPTEEEFELAAESADAPEDSAEDESDESDFTADGTELENFESAEIEEMEFLETERVQSIIESVLFATEKPQSLSVIKQAFKGTQVKTKDIKAAIQQLMVDYASGERGFTMEEVNGGYQLRTKVDNMDYLKGMVKARPFKLSGPALEVMSIVAYKQPLIKAQIDEIRGVESGHLLRALMEKNLVAFAGKSEFPGKPMLYQSTRKFLEIFGLRNLKELPSLSEIDELIPEGIGEVEEKETLGDITDNLSEEAKETYSDNEEELLKITEQISDISTSSEFFEQEKARAKAKKEAERAQDIRDALAVGEEVPTRDQNWLTRYEEQLAEAEAAKNAEVEEVLAAESGDDSVGDTNSQQGDSAMQASDAEVGAGVEDPETRLAVEESAVVADEDGGADVAVAEVSADSVVNDTAGEVETDLQSAVDRFDQEETQEGFVGDVDIAKLKSDLDVFEE